MSPQAQPRRRNVRPFSAGLRSEPASCLRAPPGEPAFCLRGPRGARSFVSGHRPDPAPRQNFPKK